MSSPSLLLKVGELARRTGLTVRTLHHYDEIGLLEPSGRSEAGYRLYSQDDVARLHGIQALQQLGLPLSEIARVLDGASGQPRQLLERQIAVLDEQVAKARELRERLAMLHEGMLQGRHPVMEDWLNSLALMETYGKYFKAEELRRILERWKQIEPEWVPLKARMREAMDSGCAPDAEAIQPLVHHWMQLMLHWMEGDFELMARWREMFRLEPSAHGFNHAPETDMLDFVDEAVALRMTVTSRHLSMDDLQGLRHVPRADWQALEAEVAGLIAGGTAPDTPAARDALAHWHTLVDRITGHDPALKAKLTAAWAAEPVLRAGSSLSPAARDFLDKVRESA